MSLLNEMLKDLDSRTPHASANLIPPPSNPHWIHTHASLFYRIVPILLLPCLTWLIICKPWHTSETGVSTTITPSDIPAKIQETIPSRIVPVDMSSLDTRRPAPSYQQTVLSTIEPVPIFNDVNSRKLNDKNSALNTFLPEVKETIQDKTLTPDLAPVQRTMANLTPEEWHDEHLNKALESIEEENYPRAIDLLTLILTQFPASIEARESLAALYLSQQELSLAYDVLDKGLEYDPHNFHLLTMKSRLLVEQGQHREALALLEKFKPDIRKEPEYYGVLAAIFETLGRSTEAGSLYQSLVSIEPSNGQYWLGYAIALENKHANQQAIEAYKRASQCENAQPTVRAYADTRLRTLEG